MLAEEFRNAVEHDLAGIFAGHRQEALAGKLRAAAGLVEHGAEGLFEIVGLAFLDDEHRVLVLAEGEELVIDQRIGDVQHIERHFGVAIEIGEAQAAAARGSRHYTCRPA